MTAPSMTPEQRLDAAIHLREPDRVPIAPLMLFFAATHAGLTMERFVFDSKASFEAIVRVFDDLGGWDVQLIPGAYDPFLYAFEVPVALKLPGRDLPADSIWQADEFEAMTVDEYNIVIDKGWSHYLFSHLFPRIRPGYGGSLGGKARLVGRTLAVTWELNKQVRYWQRRGVPVLVGSAIGTPFETLSAARSFTAFVTDMFQRPDRLIAAMDAMLPDMIKESLRIAKLTGIRRIFIGGTRGSGQFISLKHFERFYFPWLKQMVEAFYGQGMVSLLHFDSDWTKNLDYFRDLPRGCCILELDGTSDIFKAKEILGGHLCLMGDVPGTLLKLGTPQEVESYCRRLIDIVGAGGGFIFSSGCEVPHDAKFENVQAMIDTAKSV